MKKGQYSDQQILAILQQAERAEKTITELCQEHNLTENTFYRWRKRFAGAAPAGYPLGDCQESRDRKGKCRVPPEGRVSNDSWPKETWKSMS